MEILISMVTPNSKQYSYRIYFVCISSNRRVNSLEFKKRKKY